MFPVMLLLEGSRSLMEQVDCCMATYTQIFFVLVTAKDVGERRKSFSKGETLEF